MKGGTPIIFTRDYFEQAEIVVGRGTDSFVMNKGSFRYKDKVAWKRKLRLQRRCGDGDEGLIFRDDKSGIQMEFHIIQHSSRSADKLESEFGTVQEEFIARKRINIAMSCSDASVNRFWLTFPMKPEEHVYGCGETFSKFDLRGEIVRIWVAEHQNSRRISSKIIREKLRGRRPKHVLPFSKYESYYVQPTFVSSSSYYVHADGSSYMEYDFRKKDSFTIHMRGLSGIEFGESSSFTDLSELLSSTLGRPERLPDWLYDGIIIASQGGTSVIEEKLKKAKEAGIRVNGVWSQDWSGCRKTAFGYQVMWNWAWDRELYPELDEAIKRWRGEGVHFLGYINPFMAIERDIYKEAAAKGYCVKDAGGKDYLVTITTFPAAMIDFTNPVAYSWYKELIKTNLIGLGLSGWMADFGEYLPTDCVLSDGSDARVMHNRWPAIWARLNREAIEESGKLGEVFFFTRAGFTDTIRYSTMMWNGDQHVDWSVDDGLPSVIPATLSLAMSGFTMTHSDVGGYTTIMHMRRSRELLMRWMEMNVFSPLLRCHEGNQPWLNVQFDADSELLAHMAAMTGIHVKLKTYLQECVEEACEHGTPVIRPLFYHYNEQEAFNESYEYLLGRDILVAPVLEEGAVRRSCYLPEDNWIHLFSNKEYRGGHFEINAPIGQPPVFVRKEKYNALRGTVNG